MIIWWKKELKWFYFRICKGNLITHQNAYKYDKNKKNIHPIEKKNIIYLLLSMNSSTPGPWGSECADCIPLEKGRTLNPKRVSWVLHFFSWWWGSNSGDRCSVEYIFIALISKPTLAGSVSTCHPPIYQSNRFVQYIFIFYRTIRITQLKNNYTKYQFERKTNTIS